MELAVKDLTDGIYMIIKGATKARKVSKLPKILGDLTLQLYHKLPARPCKGVHKARHQDSRRLEAQENVANEWSSKICGGIGNTSNGPTKP